MNYKVFYFKVWVGCLTLALTSGCLSSSNSQNNSQGSSQLSKAGQAISGSSSLTAGTTTQANLIYPWTNNGPTAMGGYFDEGVLVINQGYYWKQYFTGIWVAGGTVDHLWSQAQNIDGIYPWTNNGPKTIVPKPSNNTFLVINQGKYWAMNQDGTVSSSGRLNDSNTWGTLANASKVTIGASQVGMLDDNGPGTVSLLPSGTRLITNKGAYWYMLNGVITGSGILSTGWAGAPTVGSDGYHPYSDNGPTAVALAPDNQSSTIINNGSWWQVSSSAGWSNQDTILNAWGPQSTLHVPGINPTSFYQIPSSNRVGIYYLETNTATYTAMKKLADANLPQYSIENIIRSNGTLTTDDIYYKPSLANSSLSGLAAIANTFFPHGRPQIGYYCMYRARTGEFAYYPDCPNITATARKHAELLWSAGVDYIVADATNYWKWATPSSTVQNNAGNTTTIDPNTNYTYWEEYWSEVDQLRPTEVLFEEWAKLRSSGIMTPQIAAWIKIVNGDAGNLYLQYLNLYNNPAYSNLVMKDKNTGKKVLFIVSNPDSIAKDAAPDVATMNLIAQNGGRNDIVVVQMWTPPIKNTKSQNNTADQVWAFGSQCWDSTTNNFTTSILGRDCNQRYAGKSPIGSQVSVSTTFLAGFASLPFLDIGKMAGQTFKKQFATAVGVRPDYILLNNWNEFYHQTFTPAQLGITATPYLFGSMGMEYEPGSNIFANHLWVDAFGLEHSRAIEPSVEGGDYYYQLMASCLRVYRGGLTSCSDASEECCNLAKSEQFVNVFSLRSNNTSTWSNNFSYVTTSVSDKQGLIASGSWKEVCSPFASVTSYPCTDANIGEDGGVGYAGPFIIFNQTAQNRVPLYRCRITNNLQYYFLSRDPTCETQTVDTQLGWVSTTKTSETPRPLYSCYSQGSQHYHWLSAAGCPATNSTGSTLLGYVK